ncbi:MAG: hypothetical protein R3F05_16155 [Planctomycetota bacterium]
MFVHQGREDGGRDEWVTIGQPDARGVVDLMVLTDHHTEFERRHVIAAENVIAGCQATPSLRLALQLT